jgi:hypothetical protein
MMSSRSTITSPLTRNAAVKWVREFYRHARSLRQQPFRYEIIPEAGDIGMPFRHVLQGNYRIIDLVDEEQRMVSDGIGDTCNPCGPAFETILLPVIIEGCPCNFFR